MGTIRCINKESPEELFLDLPIAGLTNVEERKRIVDIASFLEGGKQARYAGLGKGDKGELVEDGDLTEYHYYSLPGSSGCNPDYYIGMTKNGDYRLLIDKKTNKILKYCAFKFDEPVLDSDYLDYKGEDLWGEIDK